jgi:hypothetical protein
MKIRNLLAGFVLAMMVLGAGSINSTASPVAPSCMTTCTSVFNSCKASCAGNVQCEAECQADYNSCRCGCQGRVCLDKSPKLPLTKVE